MKPSLCYIYTSATVSGQSSVQQKVCEQINALQDSGIAAFGLFVSSETTPMPGPTDTITFIRSQNVNTGYFRSIRQRRYNLLVVLDYLKQAPARPDIIFMRYPRANMALWRFSRLWGARTVMNHVAAEVPEIHLHKNQNNSSFIAGLLGNLEFRWWPIFLEKLLGGIIRKNIRVGLCNSEDIALYQRRIAGGKYKTEIVSDGVDAKKYPAHVPPPYDEKLSLIFLKGASADASYNGLDKVFSALKNDPNCELTIVGHQLEYEKNIAEAAGVIKQVHFKAAMTAEELTVEFAHHHLALGAFGIHRRGLKSNSTLKNREYCARGIPFIFGHQDPDLLNATRDTKLWMEVAADEAPLNIADWRRFYSEFLAMPDGVGTLRQYAFEQLDYSKKMLELRNCLEIHFKEVFE
jgi:hypothetical protein